MIKKTKYLTSLATAIDHRWLSLILLVVVLLLVVLLNINVSIIINHVPIIDTAHFLLIAIMCDAILEVLIWDRAEDLLDVPLAVAVEDAVGLDSSQNLIMRRNP